MQAPLALEKYLNKLDRCLGYAPVSTKAEIVTAIKTQVMQALEKDGGQKIESILATLGDPQALANRQLYERGIKPTQRPRILLWLIFGFLGVLSLMLITTLVIIFKFSPVFEFNNGHMKFFGGTVDIKDDLGWDIPDDFTIDAHIQGFDDDGYFRAAVAGTHDVVSKNISVVKIDYHDAAMRLIAADDNNLDFKCVVGGASKSDLGVVEGNTFKLDLGNSGGAKCKVAIPKNIRVILRGHNGALTIVEPHFSVDAVLHNAKVKIEVDEKLKYRYELKADNGKIDDFTSFDNPEAIEIKIEIHNGVIGKE